MLCCNYAVGFPLSAPVLSWPFLAQETQLPGLAPNQATARRRSCPQQHATSQPRASFSWPGPQSQSFSRSYGSILPTSLIYIVLLTRGCSPWRPDAVISTPRDASKTGAGIFKDRPEGTRRARRSRALPAVYPYLRIIRFQGNRPLTSKENACWTSVRRLPTSFSVAAVPMPWPRNINLVPFR
jgi:hypothetical protein